MALRRAKPVRFEKPEKTPVSLQEVKDQAVVRHDLDDKGILRRLNAAVEWAERYTGRRFITQTWDLSFSAFPGSGESLILHYPPLQQVVHLKYYDSDGVLQVLDPAEYEVRTDVEPGEIVEAFEKSWPTARAVPKAVQVRFKCGFGDKPEDVPDAIREAICVVAATRQAFREDAVTGTIVSAAPFSAKLLLAHWVKRRARARWGSR